ncbi:hypothetical protein ElyMa_004794800 [Elysia marginata]|uniref:PiggyBac transposable element-derived protein domain-containing protein n=1 Tax=Elysia marginata TaxID=1093978 RepID=A0AAV4IKP3_9GAST|nr:hypothetical protein ElyMa_004794800 [Elysia marginata]
MKRQTNRYAKQVISQKQDADVELTPGFQTWKSVVTVTEIYNFLGILIHKALVDKPRIQHYWSQQEPSAPLNVCIQGDAVKDIQADSLLLSYCTTSF